MYPANASISLHSQLKNKDFCAWESKYVHFIFKENQVLKIQAESVIYVTTAN
jgi:hypothetical protein